MKRYFSPITAQHAPMPMALRHTDVSGPVAPCGTDQIAWITPRLGLRQLGRDPRDLVGAAGRNRPGYVGVPQRHRHRRVLGGDRREISLHAVRVLSFRSAMAAGDRRAAVRRTV